ncbi:hypothetical protein [Georgenia yuyongxinii]
MAALPVLAALPAPPGSRAAHRAPRTAHRAPRTAHRAPRTAHRAPRTAHRAPRTAHRAPRTAHRAPDFRASCVIASSMIPAVRSWPSARFRLVSIGAMMLASMRRRRRMPISSSASSGPWGQDLHLEVGVLAEVERRRVAVDADVQASGLEVLLGPDRGGVLGQLAAELAVDVLDPVVALDGADPLALEVVDAGDVVLGDEAARLDVDRGP